MKSLGFGTALALIMLTTSAIEASAFTYNLTDSAVQGKTLINPPLDNVLPDWDGTAGWTSTVAADNQASAVLGTLGVSNTSVGSVNIGGATGPTLKETFAGDLTSDTYALSFAVDTGTYYGNYALTDFYNSSGAVVDSVNIKLNAGKWETLEVDNLSGLSNVAGVSIQTYNSGGFYLGSSITDIALVDTTLNPTLSSAAPEASTWLMALLGVAGLGFVGLSKKRNNEMDMRIAA